MQNFRSINRLGVLTSPGILNRLKKKWWSSMCAVVFLFLVYLLHYVYIIIIIAALVTTFSAIYTCSRRPVQATDRKKFLVCRQESKSVYDHLFELPIRASRTCRTYSTQMYRHKRERESRNARETRLLIYLYHWRSLHVYHQPVFDNYHIYSMQRPKLHLRTKADSSSFTSNHLLLHSFDFCC